MGSKPKKWLILIPIIAGVAAIAVLKKNQSAPVQAPIQESAKLTTSITVPELTVTPLVTGYGTVMPVHSLEAVAQVKGKIVEKHPRLQKGAILAADTQLLKIDPTDYQLAIAQTEADIKALEAQLLELSTKERNTYASLKIEENALALTDKELKRKRSLIDKGGISRSELETQERTLLSQQQSVQNQKNTLSLIPSQRALLEAQLARAKVQLDTAKRNLSHTNITLPFTGRISEVNVEQAQYVREGEVLARADDLERAEIEVQIPIERFNNLFSIDQPINILSADRASLRETIKIGAQVNLREGALQASWSGRFARISDTLDTKTRTVGVIVEVDKPYDQVQPGIRPPLVKGLFVEVELTGKARPNSLVIPRSALHNGKVYLVTAENRLKIQPVTVSLTQPDYLVISDGLKAGDQIVTSDLIPAIDGMLLKPVDDEQTLAQLQQAVAPGER
ncbi:MAG: efflux RND transporter periplasmic adaptor subunit [Chromatiales bacterium]|nr:efflux RND transporter periplasmic adaptor subunit [Chromatiales bacterium]